MSMLPLFRALLALAASAGMAHAFLSVSTGALRLRSAVPVLVEITSLAWEPKILGRQPSRLMEPTKWGRNSRRIAAAAAGAASGAVNKNSAALLTFTLDKPLGMVLEEVVENQPRGVYIQSVLESGSAWQFRDQIEGRTVRSVQGRDVTRCTFEQVMDAVSAAPSPVTIEIDAAAVLSSDAQSDDNEFPIGTPVALTVLPSSGAGVQPVTVQAKVGDNLRKVLLDSGVEVYTGFQNIGNCGGAGQCGMCAFDLIADKSEGWLERSDYEDKKLRRHPEARLTCLNSIQGPATIRKTKQ